MEGVWQHVINIFFQVLIPTLQKKALVENYGKAAISSPAKATWGFMRQWNVITAWSVARAGG